MTNKEFILGCLIRDDDIFTQIVEYFELGGVGINHLLTKIKIGENTIEKHLNNFADWLIFWD